MNVFRYIDYRKCLSEFLELEENARGNKKKLAEAVNCQASYLTLVLQEKAHLTVEQAERLCRYWKLSIEETDYFLLLVSLGRSGTQELRSYYKAKIKKLKEARENLGNRIQDAELFPDTEAAVYYSSWMYLAIHILVSIPDYHSSREIAERLQLPEEAVKRVLQYLESLGLVQLRAGQWRSTRKQLHLPRESRFISLHHSNWRRRAVDNSFLGRPEDLHYTGVSSLSRQDLETLRQLVLNFIDQSRNLIGPSAEEELICLSIDLFKV